jgi:hypothetical protein
MARLAFLTVGGLLLAGSRPLAPPVSAQKIEQVHDYWTISNRQTDWYEGVYGQPAWVSLEEILRGNAPRTGAIRTRGYLRATRQRAAEAAGKSYQLTLGAVSTAGGLQDGLAIMPAQSVRGAFDFEADSLSLREVEVVGTFEAPVGPDQGTVSGFWFWTYAGPPPAGARTVAACGPVTVADVVARPPPGRGETVRVCGQFGGRDLFGDLAAEPPPSDGWVLRAAGHAIWVTGKAPRGDGFALDVTSRGDTKHWVEVEGRLETRGGMRRLRARRVALVSAAED